MDIGPSELLIVLIVLLVVFGGSKIPKLARNLGQAQSEFKKGLSQPSDPPAASSTPAAAAEPGSAESVPPAFAPPPPPPSGGPDAV